MKKLLEVEVDLCDACEGEDASGSYKCIECCEVFCYDCKDKHVVEYWSGAFVGHHYYVCGRCDVTLKKSGKNKLFQALLKIKALKDEYDVFWKDLDKRVKAAEKAVERLEHKRTK